MRFPLGVVAVAGPSMLPTLRPGDWLAVRRGATARPGDIVVVRRPDRPGLLVVKRLDHWRPDGAAWVVGDNPAASDDSRAFGPVPRELVRARVLFRYWPPGHRPWYAARHSA